MGSLIFAKRLFGCSSFIETVRMRPPKLAHTHMRGYDESTLRTLRARTCILRARSCTHTSTYTPIECDGSVLHNFAACAQLLFILEPAPVPVSAMPSPKRTQRKRAPSPSRKRPRLRLTSCARGEVSWRTLLDRFDSEQRSLQDSLSRRDAKILDLEASIAAEKRYSDRLRQERKDSPPLSMGTASVTAAIEICHIHLKLSPSLSIRRSEVSIVIDSAVIHTSASLD